MPVGPTTNGLVTDYSQEINDIPNTYGKIQQAGHFTLNEGITTTTVQMDRVSDELNILEERPRGSAPSQAGGEEIVPHVFAVPHIPHEDFLRPADLQDRRKPGDTGPDTKTRKLSKKTRMLRMAQALTLEYMRMGAIKGKLYGGSGKLLYDFYNEFGFTQEVLSLELADTGKDVPGALRVAKRYIEDNIEAGMMMGEYHCYCSASFFDKLTSHAKVSQAYQYYQASAGQADPNRNDLRTGFYYQGIVFEEYNATAKLKKTGAPVKFIEDDAAYLFPRNVPNMFRTYFAPADHIDYVNTEGQEVYMFEIDPGTGRYLELVSESNPFPINTKPNGVVKLTV